MKLIMIIPLILMFGCKSLTQAKTGAGKAEMQIAQVQLNSVYDLMLHRTETAQALKQTFSADVMVNLTDDEKKKYESTGFKDGYYLTNIAFLKSPIEDINCQVYYKISFGDQLEKLVRVHRNDTIFDLSLALIGGDGGQAWYEDTEFLNDSIIQKTCVFKETMIDNQHLMVYATDSIIKKYHYNHEFDLRMIKIDTFHYVQTYPIYHEDLKDSTFKVWSNVFTINGLKCRWEYEVRYTNETTVKSKEILVDLVSQKLVKWPIHETILDLDLALFPDLTSKKMANLESNNYEPLNFDVNFDGHTDFQFRDQIKGGANHMYFVYLFNSKMQRFEFSKVLSGGSIADGGIELNQAKRMATYSANGSGGLYQYKQVYFDAYGGVEYQERFWNEYVERSNSDGVAYNFYYEKDKNGTIVESLKERKIIENESLELAYHSFYNWIKAH